MSTNIRSEILAVVDVLANEKKIAKSIVLDAIEDAFATMAADYYSTSNSIIAEINNENGEVKIYEVVDENRSELPPIPMQRMAANSMKTLILSRIKSAEKQLEYDEYKQKEGEVVVGVVKKATPFSIIVGLGYNAEGILFRDGILKSDNYRPGDKIKACIKSVQRSDSESQIILSRTDNIFLYNLMYSMIAEIQDGIIEVKSISRDPGSKAKVAVYSVDGRLDPVGACIGTKGSRIKPIVEELKGERVDVIYWNRDIVQFAQSAITPVKSLYGSVDENTGNVELVVSDNDLKVAIGRAGQNVRLASQLVGCNITVISQSEQNEKNMLQFKRNASLLATTLDLEEQIAQFIVSSGINSLEELVEGGSSILVKTGVFTQEIVDELVSRATDYLQNQSDRDAAIVKDLGIPNDILCLDGMTNTIAIQLYRYGNIKTVLDVADLSIDEMIDILGNPAMSGEYGKIVMSARKIAY
ncbi:MAG: transcription termination/antitermination factor [Pseudomonadota bacterium]|jgi:N utilization substance protein A